MTVSCAVRIGLLFLCSLAVAGATTIDFEAQGASAPSGFTGTLNSPLVIGLATFTGGQLLRNEAGSSDTSAVYATVSVPKYADPLSITFSQPVSNVSLLITNEIPDTYTVADNLGTSSTVSLNANTGRIFSLVDSGVTQITISSAVTAQWDFAIDNVTFTAPMSSAPEPGTAILLGAALSAFALLRRFTWRAR